ncbi:hypothetical protein [Streptomyces sp. NPDC046860]|uniref:hypothetical protein n=1 Tax=Streptomyces sp. NPDC046860 TaxID=3154495 RepID=UPI0033DDFE03
MTDRAPIEERLRAALDARGRLISAHDLSPGRPPSGRTWGTRRTRRVLSVAVAAVAAAAAVVLLLSSGPPDDRRPVPPARRSSPTVTPGPTPAVPRPVPSAVPSVP